VNESLTIYNTSTDMYGLSVAFNWGIIGIALVVVYLVVQNRLTAGKVDDRTYGEH
jgi:cytochrome d ubiquinol oxidase subunit II